MRLFDLFKDAKVERVMNGVAAGQAANVSTEVDMQGYDSVLFVGCFGAITATGTVTMKARQDTATGMGSAADLLGTDVALDSDDDNRMLLLNLYRPRERFIDVVVTTATANGVIDSVVAIKYNARDLPVTQGSDVGAGETHASPAEGTA